MVTNVSPSITASPLLTLMPVMVPEVSASMLFCIFMASRITTISPALTLILSHSFCYLELLILLNFGAFHLVCLGLMVMMPDSTSCTSSRYSLRASEITAM